MTQTAQYLLTLYIAEHQLSPPVPTGRIAEMLGRSASTVTETIQRLDDEGLVSYEPYEGATLTDPGRRRAAELHETYVALSWFFQEVLDLETYEREAMEMADLVILVAVSSDRYSPPRGGESFRFVPATSMSPSVADRLVNLLVEDGEADGQPVTTLQ